MITVALIAIGLASSCGVILMPTSFQRAIPCTYMNAVGIALQPSNFECDYVKFTWKTASVYVLKFNLLSLISI